jgi:endonuclease YncB( thermonuclease family)
MQLRETLLNLAITSVLVLIVALVAMLLRESRPAPVAAIPIARAQTTPSAPGSRELKPDFERFADVSLVVSRSNEADTLRIRIRGTEEVFRLYYVDALEATWTHPQRIAEQSRYFGNASREDIVVMGEEAMRYVTMILSSRPFELRTRWEGVPNTSRYYGLIVVEMEPGKQVYLADLLMQRGFARLDGLTTYLPNDKRDIETYVHELQLLGREARTQRRGVWSRARSS